MVSREFKVLWIVLVCSLLARVSGYYALSQEISLGPAKLIFGLKPAPREAKVFLYSALGLDEAIQTGIPTLVDFKEKKIVSKLSVAEDLVEDGASVWTNNGRHLYFETEHGIYSFDSDQHKYALVVQGDTFGLAFEAATKRIAYWMVTTKNYRLVVQDLGTQKIIRSWGLPYKFGTEPFGYEMSFKGPEILWARTYDDENGTPLKQFNIRTGAIAVVLPDVSGMAEVGSGLMVIAQQGGIGKLILVKKGMNPKLLLAKLNYDTLKSTGSPRWVVAYNTHNNAAGIIETETQRIVKRVVGCDDVTVLAAGTFVFARAGRLSTNESICKGKRDF